jgi:hypothetical protein
MRAKMAGVTFNERMDGFLSPTDREPVEHSDYRAAHETGKRAGSACHFEATMVMEDIAAYVRDPEHMAQMNGTFYWNGHGVPMRNGEFQLYVKNPETGIREMRYRFDFDGADGEPLRFWGVKWMKPKSRINTWAPSTTLYSKIVQPDGSVLESGILTIDFKETAKLFRSVRPINSTNRSEGRRAVLAFNRFFMGEQLAMLREG